MVLVIISIIFLMTMIIMFISNIRPCVGETALENLEQETGYSVHQPSQHRLRHNQYSHNRRHPHALLLGLYQPPLLLAQQCQIIIAIVTKISMTSINILIFSSLPFSYCKQLSEASL